MTSGRGNVRLSEWSAHSPCSRISARSFSTRTVARRTVHTLIGSYEALSTSTRPLVPRGPTTCSQNSRGIRAEDAQLLDSSLERSQRLGDPLVVGPAHEIGEEHVVAEPDP